MEKNKIFDSKISQHKNILIVIMICFFIFELQLFAVTMMKSGRQARLNVLNNSGELIFETNGEKLNKFDKYYFEKTFGPLEKFEKKLVIKEVPFPFRAWFTAAIGFPLGTVLIIAFIYRAYFALIVKKIDTEKESMHESKSASQKNQSTQDHFGQDLSSQDHSGQDHSGQNFSEKKIETRFFSILQKLENMNIFVMGFLILIAVLSYWIFPNAISYIAKVGAETISQNRWFFISAALVLVGIVLWIVYLKYSLARKSIDAQVELRKYQYKLQLEHKLVTTPQLEYDNETLLISQNIE